MRATRTLAFVLIGLATLVGAHLRSVATAQTGNAAPYGSGSFGRWVTDQWGLPAYDYTLDERVDPRARILETNGDTAAWHQESFADGAHGLYRGAESGDWADEITKQAGLTESTMVPAQLRCRTLQPRYLLRSPGRVAQSR